MLMGCILMCDNDRDANEDEVVQQDLTPNQAFDALFINQNQFTDIVFNQSRAANIKGTQ